MPQRYGKVHRNLRYLLSHGRLIDLEGSHGRAMAGDGGQTASNHNNGCLSGSGSYSGAVQMRELQLQCRVKEETRVHLAFMRSLGGARPHAERSVSLPC